MAHDFNSNVIYVRNGQHIPAIVLKSQLSPTGSELLTLLYADPTTGPQLLAQGTTRGVAQVHQAVAPFVEGNVFGWYEPDAPESPHAIETKVYSDGITVTGPGPLPEMSPAQQDEAEKSTL